ncbi:hypothetical protein LTR37_001104 [Vermiconidia calcicola]|uniref:Uncharacterized protein n=1 Tax=Vermiconidia calcicola TaxID=1690605 RepID=A0ACC3NWI2_9PEZI|nr:hypothetical protein LTR37_001104 [Vermiconidia calcicola]
MAGLGNLIPLIILFILVGGGAYIGYQIYLWSNDLTDRGKKHMEKKHMTFTKEGGLKVGVRERSAEAEGDRTQKTLVNVWNNASFDNKKSGSSTPRQSTSRTNSSQSKPSTSRTFSGASTSGSAANLSPPASRGTQRSSSPVPGAF